ncbi:MAG: SCO family protein [Pseudomonadota bacterium]
MRVAAFLAGLTLCTMTLGTITFGTMAFAHGDHDHGTPPAEPLDLSGAVTPLPWEVGGPFTLIDHTGQTRSEVDPDGRHQLLFFGYAACPGICSAALPLMADAVDALAQDGVEVSPLLLTIDPSLDTVDTMGPALAALSPAFIGLTGEPEALQSAYSAYQVSFEQLFIDPEYGPIYSHGAHIYLLDPDGKVLTLLPPVLPTDQIVAIIKRYTEATLN